MENTEKIRALKQKEHYDLGDLLTVMTLLRSEDGCPWDREQDHHSIRPSLIEETYEVVEAIDNDDPVLLREELGDLLFQIVFHAELAAEDGLFEMSDVINDISQKMIHRHPHVFGDIHVKNSGEVLNNWESIKTEEKQRNTLAEKLHAIPPMLPALMRASKVGKKLGQADGKTREALLSKLSADLDALRTEGEEAEKLGTLLMRVCDLSRSLGIDAEEALMHKTNRVIDAASEDA